MLRHRLPSLLLILLSTWLPVPGAARGAGAEEPPLVLYYYERPPFHFANEQGQVVGSFVQAAEETLKRAKLSFTWVRLPASRILSTLRSEKRPACSPGWYSTPERRFDFKYSKAMMLDKPLIALVRADFPVPDAVEARTFFFENPRMRLLLRQNFSQGAYLNALIARIPKSRLQSVTIELPQMIRMLQANRTDLIFSTEEETGFFVRDAGFLMSDFRVVRFPDVPATEYRYMLCGQGVPAETLRRIDRAIRLVKL